MNVDLFVTAGPNRGAFVPISEGRHTVGGSDDADIVLEGLAPSGMLVFEVGSGRVKILPLAGASVRLDGRVLGRGGASLQPGSMIEFGETELRAFWEPVSSSGNAVGSSGGSWGSKILVLLLVLGGIGLFFSDLWQRDLRQGPSVAENSPQSKIEVASASPLGGAPDASAKLARAPEPAAAGVLEGVEARVRSVLRGTGLTGKVDSGRLLLSGSVLTAKDEKRLEALIAEIKPYVEVDISAVRGLKGGNAPAPAPVQAVALTKITAINIASMGPAKSYFETQDGVRYFEGAVFGDGYVVSEIKPTVVSLEKAGRKLEYPLTGR